MAHTTGLQETLFQELKSRSKREEESVPYKYGDFFYYHRYEKDCEYPIYCRKQEVLGGFDKTNYESERLFATGASAGGLFMGAIVNMEPGLYAGSPGHHRIVTACGSGLTAIRRRPSSDALSDG